MGPQISKWINSKLLDAFVWLIGKGKCLCSEKWHKSHTDLLLIWIEGYKVDMLSNLECDKWPSLKCHRASEGTIFSELQEELLMELQTLFDEKLENKLEAGAGGE